MNIFGEKFTHMQGTGLTDLKRSESAGNGITIVGSGSWATAMTMVLTANGHHVSWFIDRPEIYRHVRRYGKNPCYLPAIEFDLALISPSDNIRSAVKESGVIILVTPAAYLKAALEGLTDDDLAGKTVCSGIKGIIPGDNCVTGEYLIRRYRIPDESIVIITGPSHAEEVSTEKLTYLTFASLNSERAGSVASLFSNRWIRTLLSGDFIGTEYSAVMKNIYAIAAGITNGLGYGDNFVAVLLANAAGEMSRFVNAVSPSPRDITESPYLGDLLVTGYSPYSRNRALGFMIGKGFTVKNALLEMNQVAEGYFASYCIHEVNDKLRVDIPIAEAVYRILHADANPAHEIKSMSKKLRQIMKSDISVTTNGISSFVRTEDIALYSERAKSSLITLREGKGRGNQFTGWLHLPDRAVSETEGIKRCATRLRSQAPVTVVVGIGGSYLGTRALTEALSDPFSEHEHTLLFAGHTLSEDYHASLIRYLDQTTYNILVISKSGTTTEPAIAFRILRDHMRKTAGSEVMKSRIVAITDAQRGALHKLAADEGYETFIIPDNVGGRYSVLTPVGLLPLALAGYDVDAFVRGMRDMALSVREGDDTASNIAIAYAAARNTLYHKGYTTEILISYEPSLVYLAEWWKQLYGESEGKESKGIFPSSVTFTTDLHSMGQYIQQGERKLFETVIHVEESRHSLVVPGAADDSDGIDFIAGRSLTDVNHKAEAGTRIAHIDGGVPVIKISIKRIDEYNLGQLMYFFELACAISGYILEINPFDQPGVESYKRNMFALLGKKGFEAERDRLEKELKDKG